MNARTKPFTLLRNYTKQARAIIRLLVIANRHEGAKAPDSVSLTAEALQLSTGRTKHLFYGYRDAQVDEAEWQHIRHKAAEILFRKAEEHRRKAAYYEAKALEMRYRQETLWGDEASCSLGSSRG